MIAELIPVVGAIAPKPHADAVFDPAWRSTHDPAPLDGWRFQYRCVAPCSDDAWGTMPVTNGPDAYPRECLDCGGPVARMKDDGWSLAE